MVLNPEMQTEFTPIMEEPESQELDPLISLNQSMDLTGHTSNQNHGSPKAVKHKERDEDAFDEAAEPTADRVESPQ